MIRVRVPGGDYPVIVEAGVIRRAGAALKRLKASRVCIITNEQVWRNCGPAVLQGMRELSPDIIRIPDGEKYKNLTTVESAHDELVRLHADRDTLIIGVGGGIIGDVAGFVAATYLRGVNFVNIPTTLLAQVDSAVGGKTGVNLRGGKNLVGAFHQPKMVLVDPRILVTLPDRELRAGLFEAVKCGIIKSRPLFDFLVKRRKDVLGRRLPALVRVIHDCLAIKARVVMADEHEDGERRILNFGHTIGHALESETSYSYFLHGEAVAWGMIAATRLAENLGMLPAADAARIYDAVADYGPIPPLPKLDSAKILNRMLSDKKTRRGVVHFVLPTRIGAVKVVPGVPAPEIERVLDWLATS